MTATVLPPSHLSHPGTAGIPGAWLQPGPAPGTGEVIQQVEGLFFSAILLFKLFKINLLNNQLRRENTAFTALNYSAHDTVRMLSVGHTLVSVETDTLG